VLGAPGEKDVDFARSSCSSICPRISDDVLDEARAAVDRFNAAPPVAGRMDLSGEVICTIDPDDAKDYDDAISLKRLGNGHWELGVHIADVSHFVQPGGALDEEASKRGNSCYFPGYVIPMLPEILSNGVCSLQEGVPRLCKSTFITFDDNAQPIGQPIRQHGHSQRQATALPRSAGDSRSVRESFRIPTGRESRPAIVRRSSNCCTR
jgi:ribonuclease R